MKEKDVIQRVMEGERLCVLEYRTGKSETITWRDPSGRRMTAPIVKHAMESKHDAISVSERVPDDFDIANFRPRKKGERVVVHIASLTITRGAIQIQAAAIEPLEPGA